MILFLPIPPPAPDAVEEIRKMLRSPVAMERRSAARAIRERELVELLRDLAEVAGDSDPWVRWEIGASLEVTLLRAMDRVKAKAESSAKEDLQRLREVLTRLQGAIRDSETRDALELGSAYPQLAFLLRTRQDSELRLLAARALARTTPDHFDPEEVPSYHHGDGVKGGLFNYLSKHRPDIAGEVVRQVMEHNPNRSYVVSEVDLKCLNTIRSGEWNRWLNSPYPQVREAAADAVVGRRDRRLWTSLLRRSNDRFAGVRVRALRALVEIDPARAFPTYIRRLEHAKGDELMTLLRLPGADYVGINLVLRRLAAKADSGRREMLLNSIQE